jgi:HTH-type transcriptional regulator/antitoxin HigA
MMEIRPIHTKAEYRASLKRVSVLMDLDPDVNTPDGNELEVLLILVERYEDEHYPVEKPDPIEAIRFRMEQSGMTVADLRPYIGPSHRVYEVLNRTRPLSLAMIRKLHEGLKIPADVLIGAAA